MLINFLVQPDFTQNPKIFYNFSGTPSSVTSRGSRTGSPALKRQSSRTSMKKDTDSDEDDSENGSSSLSRKSSRLSKTTNSNNVPSSPSGRIFSLKYQNEWS